MTAQLDLSASDPQGIGNAFVEQFYTVLHHEPTQAYKFYLDLSVLSRPDPDGSMKSVTSIKDINELILSLDYQSYKAEITFVDAQFSYGNGVIVLVIGSLIGKDNVRRKFTQSFFLAPQERGFYVLNDVFRYVGDAEQVAATNNDVDESTQAPLSPEPELTQVPKNVVVDVVENHVTAPSDNGDNNGEEVTHSLDNHNSKDSVSENGFVAEQQLVPSSERSQNDSHPVSQTASSSIQDDAPKKSYLSVVHELTKNSAPFIVRPPPPKPKPVEKSARPAVPEAPAPKSNKALERNNESSVKNTSIFVANLPMNATEETLSEVFKKFGPIKPNGIQVRSFKENKNCFGFVEFESATSMQSAVEASPITIGNRQANIEEKRGSNNGGRSSWGGYRDENGYRNDNFRGSGNFNGGRNSGRKARSEFSGHARGNTGRKGDTNKKIYQNGGQRVAAHRDESQS